MYISKKTVQLFLLLIFSMSHLFGQDKFTISGYVKDAESGETLIGATAYEATNNTGMTTNLYGFYSLTLPAGNYEIVYSYVGFQQMTKRIELSADMEMNIELKNGETLQEVVVTAETSGPSRHQENRMSTTKLSMDKVESLPVLMGERDVIKIIQLLPGIQSGSEGSSGLYVRGGGPDQNLLLLDGVPIYNANHLFGFMSVFNGDAIKSAEVIKGGFPARYGGRLSSVLDIRMKEGNLKKIQGSASVGLVSGKFNLEGPIITDKTSFNISGRRTWIDLLTTPIQKQRIKKGKQQNFAKYHFYDLNMKVNHQFAPGNRLYASAYLGDDKMSSLAKNTETGGNGTTRVSSDDAGLKWGNKIFALRWNKQLTPKLFSNTTLTYSQYKFNLGIKFNENENETNPANQVIYDLGSFSEIKDYTAKIDFDYIPTSNHYIRFGGGIINHQFKPTVISETITAQNANVTNTQGGGLIKGNEYYAYIEDDMTISSRLKINPGLHFSGFSVENSNYTSFQPRLSASFLIDNKSSIKASYSHMTQFVHLLSSPGLGLPTDLWVPSTDKIKPESAIQYGLAYTRSLPLGLEMSVEGFYKTMNNLLEYKDGISVFGSSRNWQEKVVAGKGESYGGEFLLEKKQGNTTGWIGYTLSWSNRTVPGLNFGRAFPYKYDRRHDISVVATHKFSERMDIGAVWVYGTGVAYTLPTQVYQPLPEADIFPDFGGGGDGEGFENDDPNIKYIGSRNNQRVPAYHRLDLSVNLHKELKIGKRTWSFGVYNAYNRKNPFSVSALRQSDGTTRLRQTSLLPILPYFSYNLKF